MKVRPITLLAATADELSTVRREPGKALRRLVFTQASLARYAAAPDTNVPLMLAHRGDVDGYAGVVTRWELDPRGRELHAHGYLTRAAEVAVGDGCSLGLLHTTRLDDAGHSRITAIRQVLELSIGLASGPALKSSRVLALGAWSVVPDAEAPGASAMAAWLAAGLPVGHSTIPGVITSAT